MRTSTVDRRFRRASAALRQALGLGIMTLGLCATPTITALADDQADDREAETLVLNRGRTFVGMIVDANSNTVAIRNGAGLAEIVRTDDIQTVYIPARRPGDKPFFGSFVDWNDGVYQLNVNFQLVRVKDGIMQGAPQPLARQQPVRAVAVARSEPVVERTPEPALRKPSSARDVVKAAATPPSGGTLDSPLLVIESDRTDEGATAITYRLTLSTPLDQPFYLAYSTLDGTAHAGEDYQAERDILVIAPGERSAELRILLIDDDRTEADETFTLSVGASDRLVKIERSSLETVIVDND